MTGFQVYIRKNPQDQVTDRMWAESMVELPYKENVEGSVEEGTTGRLSSEHMNWRVQ